MMQSIPESLLKDESSVKEAHQFTKSSKQENKESFSSALKASLETYKNLLNEEALQKFLQLEKKMGEAVGDQKEYSKLQKQITQAFRDMIGLSPDDENERDE